jgi:hypothetical protein
VVGRNGGGCKLRLIKKLARAKLLSGVVTEHVWNTMSAGDRALGWRTDDDDDAVGDGCAAQGAEVVYVNVCARYPIYDADEPRGTPRGNHCTGNQ